MAKTLTRKIPYVQASMVGGRQKPSLIVLRNSMTSSTEGSALAIAMFWHQSNAPESCHYVIDEAKTYQCVPDQVVSLPSGYGPPGSIVINLCGEPENGQLVWEDADHIKIVEQAAKLVADLIVRHRIRPRLVDALQEHEWYTGVSWKKKSRGGILLDVQGDWPRRQFLADVQQQVSKKRR